VEPPPTPQHPVCGETRPVSARKDLQGRQNIIMTEWGPWDHQSPLIRRIETTASSHVYDMHRLPTEPRITLTGPNLIWQSVPGKNREVPCCEVISQEPGVHPYTLNVVAGDYRRSIKGTLVDASWKVTFFNWPKETDPREQLEDWRKLAQGESAVSLETGLPAFRFGMGGPSSLKLSPELTKAKIGPDHFGMIAEAKLPLPKGRWKLSALSDDGVRVTVNGKALLDDWSWHTPKRHEAIYEASSDATIEIMVEYFEIDGYAVIEFSLKPES